MNLKQTNWHTYRTIGLIAIMVVIGGLQAIHGVSPALDSICGILLIAEHMIFGNSNPINTDSASN